MMNRMAFKNYQSMNLVHRSGDGGQLWLGDYYAASNTSLLKQKGIKSVLTSAAMLGITYPKDHEINHKIINAFDIPSYKMTPHFEEAYHFIEDALKRGHLLVHCAAGISRSTTFVLVYLMRKEGMSFKQALDYVRNKRSIICPNYGFQNELKRFQLTLKKQPKKERSDKEQSRLFEPLTEKKAVFDFINEDKKRPLKAQEKFSMTSNGKQRMAESLIGKIGDNNSNFLRGKSVNYSQKANYTFWPGNSKMSLGLQKPKIVTIKR